MKIIRHLFLGFLLLFFLLAGFLLFTESGLHLMQLSINRLGGGMLSIAAASGRLAGDWSLAGVRLVVPGTEVSIESVEWSWQPSRLLVGELRLASLSIAGLQIELKEGPETSATDGPVEVPKTLLPIAVVLEQLTVDRLRVVGSDGGELIDIDKISAQLKGSGERLDLGNFNLESQDIGFALRGSVELSRNWSLDLSGNLRFAGFGFHRLDGTYAVKGPLNSPHLELSVSNPASIRVSADVENLLKNPEWSGTLHAEDVDLSALILYCPQILLSTVDGDLSGDFGSYRGLVKARGSWDELTDMELVSRLDGDGLGIDFQSLRIDRGESVAEVKQGKISWKDIFGWEGRFIFKDVDPSLVTRSLQGKLTTEFFSIGDVKEQGVVASFEIFSLDTYLRDQHVFAKGNVFLTENAVHTDGLSIRSAEMEGAAHIDRGLFSWADESHWSTTIRLDAFNPAWLHPDFPGSVSGKFSGEGSVGNNGPNGSIKIEEISGTLQGNVLSGGGEISLSGESVQTAGLHIKSGLSELTVQGRAGDDLGLDFAFSSPDLGQIVAEGGGSLLLKGSLKGSRTEPQLDASIEGKGLRYREDTMDHLQVEVHTALKRGGSLTGFLDGRGMSVSGVSVSKAKVDVSGTLQDHQFIVRGSGGIGELQARVRGAYQEQWQGKLSQVHFDSSVYGKWLQQGKTAVAFGGRSLDLGDFCLSDTAGKICLKGDVQMEEELRWTAHGRIESLSLKWLNRLEFLTAPVKGDIQADLFATGDSRRVLSGKIDVRLPEADIRLNIEDDEQVPFYFDDSLLTLGLKETLLHGQFSTTMRNGSEVFMDIDVEGVGDFARPLQSLPVKGTLDLKELNLAMLSVFTGYSVESTGLLNSSLTLSGTVAKPLISGESSIVGGGINLLHQGVFLENVTMFLEAGEEGAKVTASAGSGPGEVKADGVILYGNSGLEGEIYIQGSDFLLVDLPEYTLRVNPDLKFLFTKARGEIKGTVKVPYGRIIPEEMSGSITTSEDVIIVNGVEEEEKKGWPFFLNLNVQLDDDVRIDGYGLTGRLGGGLRVNTTPDYFLTGKGALDLIDGTFSVYGRTLEIERGRVLFTGGPIDNPGVDVRAQVEVSDLDARGKGYTVGLDISGLMQDLKFHLFSDPFMEDTEIISLLVAGQSSASSKKGEGSLLGSAAKSLGLQGDAKLVQELGSMVSIEGSSKKEDVALVVGKRLTRDLYIGYDVNMFNQLGQFRVRYDLVRGFSVETRSSSESTGADLIYSFEK